MSDETIISAALRVGTLAISLPRFNRHGDIMREMGRQGIENIIPPGDQGFLTSAGRFVDRISGAELALAAKQISKLKYPPYLYSEDLW